jgi:hypothetical protein
MSTDGNSNMARCTRLKGASGYVHLLPSSLTGPARNNLHQEDRLIISDPAALKFVLNDTGTFVRSTQQQNIVRALIGEKSLLFVNGIS